MSEKSNEISLRDLTFRLKTWWGYLFAKWTSILAFSIAGGIIGIVYATYKEPTYIGTLTFVLSNDSKSGGLASIAGQLGIDVGNNGNTGAFEGENIIELLKSQVIIKEATFKQVHQQKGILINLIAEKSGFFKAWEKSDRIKKLIPFPEDKNQLSPTQDSLIAVLHEYIVKYYVNISKVDKKLSFYTVSTTSPNEIVCVNLTENLVVAASKMYIDTKTKSAKENLLMLQHEADSLSAILSGNIYETASTIDGTFNLNPALQKSRTVVQNNQVQGQVLGAAYAEVIRNLEIAKITLLKETPLYQIIDKPSLPLVRRKPGKLKCGIMGAFIAGLCCVIFIIIRRTYLDLMKPSIA